MGDIGDFALARRGTVAAVRPIRMYAPSMVPDLNLAA
jgi:hypothetical protein